MTTKTPALIRAEELAAKVNAAAPDDPEGRGLGWVARAWAAPGKSWARVYVKAASRSGRELGSYFVPAEGAIEYTGKMSSMLSDLV